MQPVSRAPSSRAKSRPAGLGADNTGGELVERFRDPTGECAAILPLACRRASEQRSARRHSQRRRPREQHAGGEHVWIVVRHERNRIVPWVARATRGPSGLFRSLRLGSFLLRRSALPDHDDFGRLVVADTHRIRPSLPSSGDDVFGAALAATLGCAACRRAPPRTPATSPTTTRALARSRCRRSCRPASRRRTRCRTPRGARYVPAAAGSPCTPGWRSR